VTAGVAMYDPALLAILDDSERHSRPVAIRFVDGEVYDLRIISTAHAEEGDDVVAEVVHHVRSSGSARVPDGAFINFCLPEVEQVLLDGECVFRREAIT
jgi:hypothetical protein